MPLGDLLDLSVNETMSRTIMTVGTVFMALLALYFFGGEVIRGFTFAMLFGVLVGTYSSVFIAAPFLILIGVKRDWSGLEKAKAAQKEAAARGTVSAGATAKEALPLARGRRRRERDASSAVKPASQAEASKAALAAVAARKGGVQRPSPGRGKGQAARTVQETRLDFGCRWESRPPHPVLLPRGEKGPSKHPQQNFGRPLSPRGERQSEGGLIEARTHRP